MVSGSVQHGGPGGVPPTGRGRMQGLRASAALVMATAIGFMLWWWGNLSAMQML